MKRHWMLLLALADPLTRGHAQSPEFSATRTLLLERLAKDSAPPGVAIAVARGDSILWEEGFGLADREAGVRVTPHTPFYLASVSKTITATAAMILRERGKLDLDRPANDYLSSPIWSPAWDMNRATVRRLMNHTSGLTTFSLACGSRSCTLPPNGETIRRWGVVVWPPGEEFDYSNIGFLVLGEVVAGAAGKDLGTVLRDELFTPLGMTHSSFGVDPKRAGETAIGYSSVFGQVTRDTIAAHRTSLSGASHVHSSAHDLALFGMMHVKARRGRARPVLSDASIDMMQRELVDADGGMQYGLGWWVQDRFGYRTLLAQGGTDASQTWVRVVPSERIVVVVLMNKGVGYAGDIVDAALAALLPRYAEAMTAQRAQLASGSPPARPTHIDSAFVGTWTGLVRGEKGDMRLELTIGDTGQVQATLEGENAARRGRARMSTPNFRVDVDGNFESPDSTAARRLNFYLTKRGDALNGTVTTQPPTAGGLVGRVSYWVDLRRKRGA